MSDQTQSSNQKTIVIALVVVAVLLAALVGVLVYQQAQASKLANMGAPVATAPTGGAANPMGAATTGEAAPFDEKTATKVPKDQSIEEFLKAYHEAVVAGKYEVAYKMLPLDKQKSYGDANSYAAQLKGYGINGYKLGAATENGDESQIVALMENPSMPITYTWSFKKVGEQWYVTARAMGGEIK